MGHRLGGKVALITGAASGIGREIALRFAEAGASIVAADINAAGGAATEQAIRANGGQCTFHELDVKQRAAWDRVVEATTTEFGKLDILVNNAGIAGEARIEEVSEELWDQILAVNLKGVFLGTQAALTKLSDGGVILNVASVAGLTVAPGFAPYGASKAAVIHLTKITAIETAHRNIRANVLCPAWTETPMLDGYVERRRNPGAIRTALEEAIPLGRFGTPADMANAALYLASDEASFITGVVFPVDGGLTTATARRARAK
jgi:NAD(P)-dependent dehydrogenase (short-subunit alcohol dehydrogenase family)